jgi:hypothetical protein
MTVDLTAALLELRIRQAQMLNLEVRFFILLLASQLLFGVLCGAYGSMPQTRSIVRELGAAATFTAILLIAVGTNAKMGLSASYLRQLEGFLETNGGVGVVWERSVMGTWVLIPGNAFTLAAGAAACIFLGQFYWLWWRPLSLAVSNRLAAGVVTIVLTLALGALAAKAASVDFGKPVPDFFHKSQ